MIHTDAQRRKLQRERTAKHRAKIKNEAAHEDKTTSAAFDLRRVSRRLVMPGEREPFTDAESVRDALAVAREFLVALSLPDVQPGESLLDVERRVLIAWHLDGRLLNRDTVRLDDECVLTRRKDKDFVFEISWISLPGSDEIIDIASLPVITQQPELAETFTVAPVVQDTAEEIAAREHAQNITRLHQAFADQKSREICASNLEREMEREIREQRSAMRGL